MKRTTTKIGDVFSVKINESTKKYMQYIVSDLTQLNSDVIRAFKKEYPINATPDLSDVVKGEVDFYAHCVTKWGCKLGHWEKVGNIADVGNLNSILFRDTNDCGVKAGEEPVRISQRWYVWRPNDEKFTHVGSLSGENRKAEIGIVIAPHFIVHRLQTGIYNFSYPGFE